MSIQFLTSPQMASLETAHLTTYLVTRTLIESMSLSMLITLTNVSFVSISSEFYRIILDLEIIEKMFSSRLIHKRTGRQVR